MSDMSSEHCCGSEEKEHCCGNAMKEHFGQSIKNYINKHESPVLIVFGVLAVIIVLVLILLRWRNKF